MANESRMGMPQSPQTTFRSQNQQAMMKPEYKPMQGTMAPSKTVMRPQPKKPTPPPAKVMSQAPVSQGGVAGAAMPAQPLGSPVGLGQQMAPAQIAPQAPADFGQGRPMMNRQIPYNANGRAVDTSGPGLLQRDYRPF